MNTVSSICGYPFHPIHPSSDPCGIRPIYTTPYLPSVTPVHQDKQEKGNISKDLPSQHPYIPSKSKYSKHPSSPSHLITGRNIISYISPLRLLLTTTLLPPRLTIHTRFLRSRPHRLVFDRPTWLVHHNSRPAFRMRADRGGSRLAGVASG